MLPSMVQLRQRISTICHIDPLSTEEVGDYIAYRLRQAGYHGESLFSESALRLIAEASQGTPRTINNLCDNALHLCWTRKSKQVDSGMVAQAIGDLRLVPRSEEPVAPIVKVEDDRAAAREPFKEDKRRLRHLIPATSGGVLFWIPATFLLMISALGVYRAIDGRAPQLSKPEGGQSPQGEMPSRMGSAPAAANAVERMVAKPSANGANAQRKRRRSVHYPHRLRSPRRQPPPINSHCKPTDQIPHPRPSGKTHQGLRKRPHRCSHLRRVLARTIMRKRLGRRRPFH